MNEIPAIRAKAVPDLGNAITEGYPTPDALRFAFMAGQSTPAVATEAELGVSCGVGRFCDRPRGHTGEHGAWVETTTERIRAAGLPEDLRDAFEAGQNTPREWHPLADGWPSGEDMIRQLLRSLGEFDGARDQSPKSVWDGAIETVRLLATEIERLESQIEAMTPYADAYFDDVNRKRGNSGE